MRITGQKAGIKKALNQDVLHSSLKRGILDIPLLTTNNKIIDFEIHAVPISVKILLRDYQYVMDLRVENDEVVKLHIISLDESRTPIPRVELFPGVFTNPEVTYFIDIDGEKVLNTITDKIDNHKELDYTDAYCLALMPFFRHEKNRSEVLIDMCHFINNVNIPEEFKYLIKLCQILLVQAILVDDEQEEMLGVIKMGSTYIDRYFKKQREDAVNEGKKQVAVKMKKDGFDAETIFKYCGLWL